VPYPFCSHLQRLFFACCHTLSWLWFFFNVVGAVLRNVVHAGFCDRFR